MVRPSPNSRIRRVLAVGCDVSQLSSGANLLTQAGYTTDLIVTLDRAVRRAATGRYQLAIVSTAYSYDEQLAIRAGLKLAKPSLPVLLLAPEHDTPETFLEAVAAVFNGNKPARVNVPSAEIRADELIDS